MSPLRRADSRHRPLRLRRRRRRPRPRSLRRTARNRPRPLVTTGLVIAEAGFLIDRQVGRHAEEALVADIVEGRIVVETLDVRDWQRTLELVRTYADLPLGVTDASLIALAERRRVDRIATLDRRHFRVVRPAHVDAFTLVP